MKFTQKQIALFTAVLLVMVAVFAGIYFLTAPATHAGSKTITVETSWDDAITVRTIETEQEFLGQALVDSGFVTGNIGSMGLYIITVDNRTVDDSKQEWWCITKGGETLNTGADSTPIADGDSFELTLKTGF